MVLCNKCGYWKLVLLKPYWRRIIIVYLGEYQKVK